MWEIPSLLPTITSLGGGGEGGEPRNHHVSYFTMKSRQPAQPRLGSAFDVKQRIRLLSRALPLRIESENRFYTTKHKLRSSSYRSFIYTDHRLIPGNRYFFVPCKWYRAVKRVPSGAQKSWVFWWGQIHYEGKWEGIGGLDPGNRHLSVPCEMASSCQASAIWGPIKSRFPGPNPSHLPK